MASEVYRWRTEAKIAAESDECRVSHDEATRIALAAAEWEEWSSCNLDHERTEMLQAIMRGEGPHGQKLTEGE